MVVFVDYDRDSYDEQHLQDPAATATAATAILHSYVVQPDNKTDVLAVKKTFYTESSSQCHNKNEAETEAVCDDRRRLDDDGLTLAEPSSDDRNVNAFSRCLGCYPVVRELARYLDLNSLDALSRTCRQNRANLLPFCSQLVKRTLRCENEYIETLSELLSRGTALPESVKNVIQLINQENLEVGRLTSGKIGKCARDMVGECRRCSTVICRNCTIKPPSAAMLKNRLRRLCKTCCAAPFSEHLSPERKTPTSDHPTPPTGVRAFTYSAFARTPCRCEDTIWLCHTCGHSLRNNDTTYRRVWTWRTRYGAYLGAGLGTGIGEGCQGVKCGKGENCLAAQAIELEVVCEGDGSEAAIPHQHHHNHFDDRHANKNTLSHGIAFGERNDGHQHDDEPGYLRQEIVGIGGVVKQKAKKRVVVGACVEEYEDERETGRYLQREETGQERSWCGWCWRVVPSRKDLEEEAWLASIV